MDKNKDCLDCRRNKVGGQAVIEGVMMKNGEEVCLAMRKEDGTVEIARSKFVSVRKKHKWLNIPILRGIIGFVESMILSFKTLNKSTEILGIEEDTKNKDGESSGGGALFITILGLILGVGLAVVLFMWLPGFITKYIERLTGTLNEYLKAAIEGGVKIVIFILYLLSTTLMKDMRRVFQYHGAEHKSIACYESGMELTPENARKCTRFHPRCGTSFLFVMLLIGIVAGMFIPIWDKTLLRAAIKLAIFPVIVGVGYEFIMFAGKHDNFITRLLSAPGLWMQRISTKEPDDYQLAIAICAIKSSMPEEFPDFDPAEYFMDIEQNKDHIAFTGMKEKEIEERIAAIKAEAQTAEKKADETTDDEIKSDENTGNN